MYMVFLFVYARVQIISRTGATAGVFTVFFFRLFQGDVSVFSAFSYCFLAFVFVISWLPSLVLSALKTKDNKFRRKKT